MRVETSMTIVICIVLGLCICRTAFGQDMAVQPHDSLSGWIFLVVGGSILFLMAGRFK